MENFKKNYNETQQSILNELDSLKASCLSIESKIEPLDAMLVCLNITDSNVDSLLKNIEAKEPDLNIIQHSFLLLQLIEDTLTKKTPEVDLR